MPSFSREQIEQWRVERVESALKTRRPTEHEIATLREELDRLEAAIPGMERDLRDAKETRRRIWRKLARE